jgi:hypothetical protein
LICRRRFACRDMNGIHRRAQTTARARSFGHGCACAVLGGKGLSAAYFKQRFLAYIYLPSKTFARALRQRHASQAPPAPIPQHIIFKRMALHYWLGVGGGVQRKTHNRTPPPPY